MLKVGDKVKATLGENVLVGEVIAAYAADLIEIMVSDEEGLTLDRDGWHFEQVMSVPTKFGAVIRRADGRKFVLAFGDEVGAPDWWNPVIGWVTTETAIGAGFTVLFEGVYE